MAHPDYIREKAIQLRIEKKLTIDEIAERLSLGKTTIYYWVNHLEIPRKPGFDGMSPAHLAEAQKLGNAAMQAKYRKIREVAYQQGLDEFEGLSSDLSFRDFVCMYIGEGSRRDRNTVAICNSDPTVVVLGNKWIKQEGKNKIRYSVQYHADQDLDEIVAFWSQLLGVPSEAINLQRKSNSNQLTGRSWRSEHGVLTVSMGDTRLRARLQAWMDLVREEWK